MSLEALHIHEKRKRKEKFLLLVSLISIPVGTANLGAILTCEVFFDMGRGGRKRRLENHPLPVELFHWSWKNTVDLQGNMGDVGLETRWNCRPAHTFNTQNSWCLPIVRISPFPVGRLSRLFREATERMLESLTANWARCLWSERLCDSTQLFTLVSMTHSCPSVREHGRASEQPASPPLWPSVRLTGRSQAWFLLRFDCQRISAEYNPPNKRSVLKKAFTKTWGPKRKKIFNQHIVQHYREGIRKHAFS